MLYNLCVVETFMICYDVNCKVRAETRTSQLQAQCTLVYTMTTE
jgi:hypothetical protein